MIHEPKPRMTQVTVALAAFSSLFAIVVFGAVISHDPQTFRISAAFCAAAVLIAPAMYRFAETYRDDPLDNWWRLSWTAGLFMALVHTAFQLSQSGLEVAFSGHCWWAGPGFGVVLVIWVWDVITAWFRVDWRESDYLFRRVAFWAVFSVFLLKSALHLHSQSTFDALALSPGLVIIGAAALGAVQRRASRNI